MTTWALVPCKRFDLAKRRLAEVLSAAERRALLAAALDDVLACLGAVPGLDGVAVITAEPEAVSIATAHGAHVLEEPEPAGLVPALELGRKQLLARGMQALLVVPSDVPFATASEIAELLAALPDNGVAIAPDHRGEGTNALALRPPDAIPFLFGPGSFARHIEAAKARGVTARTIEAPGLALDLDTRADLQTAARSRAGTRAAGVVARTREAKGALG
jgi:2-phospho-L-lactate/phosphoenolpyruvate guanylyltransferase